MMNKKILYEILDSRENRASMQKNIIKRYKKSLISFTLNIPGPKKDSAEYRRIHDIGMGKIIDDIEKAGHRIEYIKSYYKNTGAEGYLVIDIEPIDLKKITIKIEEIHTLGRIFDIDVFDANHNLISRNDLGLAPRKCLLCLEDAKVCSKQGSHPIGELLERIDQLYDMYFNKE